MLIAATGSRTLCRVPVAASCQLATSQPACSFPLRFNPPRSLLKTGSLMSFETATRTPGMAASPECRTDLLRSFVCLVVGALGTLNDKCSAGWPCRSVPGCWRTGVRRLPLVVGHLLVHAAAFVAADARRLAGRSVQQPQRIVWCKAAEVVVMLLGMGAILSGSAACLFASLFLMGTQAALFAPSKFGSIPEMLRTDKLSAGNGLMAMVTVMTAAGGTVAGFKLFVATQPDGTHNIWIPVLVVTVVAVAGWLASLGIRPLPAAARLSHSEDPVSQNWKQLKLLASSRL